MHHRDLCHVSAVFSCAPAMEIRKSSSSTRPGIGSETAPKRRFSTADSLSGVAEFAVNRDYVAQTEHLMYWMRRRASEAGCEAVIILGSADVVAGTTMGAYSTRATYRGLRGTCVVYR